MGLEENIALSQGDDPEMLAATKQARKTFKYFWRELSWERRRIIPGLDFAAVKIGFSDADMGPDDPEAEHMWVSDIECNGREIRGILNNDPEWVTSVKAGDPICEPMSALSDWIFAINGRAYGGFTVNLIRGRMPASERRAHDQAWGMEFGDPEAIEVVYVPTEPVGFLGRLFGKKPVIDPEERKRNMIEHPMCVNMEESLREALQQSKEMLTATDDEGWTMLHRDALAGNATVVKLLLEHGADPTLKTPEGDTPYTLAKRFGWKHVMKLLPN
ncbi:Ankyrin repeats (3 copies) [Gimesia panareensis]|uniref:Ankyrin repeats (3 copies) n=1 Tax=Gimesia panareensis TaxID=2527978 RepID=A0A518FPE4_9PLAN|nr:DUF2314 domain-containing protein [Gimesia panareensis]QDV18207.1 Ankyrin repeats (3 copies) [Gimesia panareensis]